MVGIETTDDVVSHSTDGTLTSEQLKHTLIGRDPFTDRSRSLWKTLAIWCEALNRGEIKPEATKLHLVTNATVGDGLARRVANAATSEDIEGVRHELLAVARSISGEAAASAAVVLGTDEQALAWLINCISIVDGSDGTGSDLDPAISELLNIPSGLPSAEILQSLLGWIHSTCMENWRAGKPAWLRRAAFKERLLRVLSRYVDRQIVERTSAAIPISQEDRERHGERLFLKQIEILQFGDELASEMLLEALDDFIRCLSERTRLLEEGYISGVELTDFEDRLFRRWQLASRVHWGRQKDADMKSPESCGQQLYNELIGHREPLAGFQTEQYYLTSGHLHRLADHPPRIGWHPNHKRLLREHAHE